MSRVACALDDRERDHDLASGCLVVISTEEPVLLGKWLFLESNPTRVGRGADNHVVLTDGSTSRRHAHFERCPGGWLVIDDGSARGTYCNDEQISRERLLKNGDRVKIGSAIFEFRSGADVETRYLEENMDGLTQIHNKRYLLEALGREIIRGRRHELDLAILLFDIDHFECINDVHGHLAGDFVLKELARVVRAHIRRGEVFARYGGDEFAVLLPSTSVETAVAVAETFRQEVSEHSFVFQGDDIRPTISVGAALLLDSDRSTNDLLVRADERLYFAKSSGRNRVSA